MFNEQAFSLAHSPYFSPRVAVLPAALVLVLVLVAAVPAVAAGAPRFGSCGVLGECGVAELAQAATRSIPGSKPMATKRRYRLEYATAESGTWFPPSPLSVGSGSISVAEGEEEHSTSNSPGSGPKLPITSARSPRTQRARPNSPIISFRTESFAPRAVGTTVVSTTATSAEVQGQLKPHLETQWHLEYATAEAGPWT